MIVTQPFRTDYPLTLALSHQGRGDKVSGQVIL
jgi:hypothetical protein